MNPIQYAIDQVMLKIPNDILKIAFVGSLPYGSAIPESISTRIREQVIERRVRTDCNLIGGHQVDIPLINVPKEFVDPFNIVYRIPKNLTQGRTITRAISVVFSEGAPIGRHNRMLGRSSPMLDAAAGVMDSQTPIPTLSSTYVTLVGENVILVKDNYSLPRNIFLRCWLENDENMTHLKPNVYRKFAKLVLYATQSYIYNQLVVTMDRGVLSSGVEIGRIREIIDEYRDAEENYDTYFEETWMKVSQFNDDEFKKRHVKRITGGLH